jgi:hypothetical protein
MLAALDFGLLIIVVLCSTQLLCGSAPKTPEEGESSSLNG